jgi:hypothetical protein
MDINISILMTIQTGITGCTGNNNIAAEIQPLPHSKHDLFLKGKLFNAQ